MITYLTVFSQNYALIILINLILTIAIISLERKNPTSALAWLFFMTLMPGIGFLFYILLSGNISKRKIFKYTSEETMAYNNILTMQRQALLDGHFQFNEPNTARHLDMILFHNRLSESFYSQNNVIKVYTNGKEKFDDLILDIKNATKHIHLQYFIVKNDNISNEIFQLCISKALEGVEVRLLFDHVGSHRVPKSTILKLKKSGCQVAFFFPSTFKFINMKANYRNHRKIAVIDGDIGYVGGFNIGDEYLGYKKKFGKWRDTHLRITGDSVFSLQMRFILDWRTASNEKLYALSRYIKLNDDYLGRAGVQIVSSGPDNINEQIKQGYIKMINKATRYIYIQTPYFVPDESILEALKIAAVSGVDVRIMFPNKPDHIFVYWTTYSYIGELIKYGVSSYIYQDGFIHTKGMVIDDEVASYGTCNFDIRSFKLNFEVNAFIYDSDTATTLRKTFENDLHVCTELTADLYNKRSMMIKVKESISRLFSPVL